MKIRLTTHINLMYYLGTSIFKSTGEFTGKIGFDIIDNNLANCTHQPSY